MTSKRSALALLVVVMLGELLAGCGNGPPPASATTAARPDPTPGGPADESAVAVYFIGTTPQGPRLYREFHRVSGDDPPRQAVDLLARGASDDPDYRSLLPALDVSSVYLDDGTDRIVVRLAAGSKTTDSSLDAARSRLAVQSLVWTVQAFFELRTPVRVVQGPDETPVRLLGVDTTDGVRAEPQLDVLALVNITSPTQGARVADRFAASGRSSSFEATTPWLVRDGARTVLRGSTTADGWVDRLYPWRAEVDVSSLAPGRYTFVAMTDDPSGGTEGKGPTQDTRTIVVS